MKRNILRDRLVHQVLVTLKTGDAFRGVFYKRDGEAIVLRDAEHIHPASDKQFVPADGEIVVLMDDIAYFQFL